MPIERQFGSTMKGPGAAQTAPAQANPATTGADMTDDSPNASVCAYLRSEAAHREAAAKWP